jgi:hypothetical protein
MEQQRTNGMKIVGYLNIGIGALFTLIGGLMALSGGGFMASSSARAAGTPADFIMLIGVATVAINLMLLVSGFGVLRPAAWGRSLALAYGAMGVVIYASAIIGIRKFDPGFIAAFIYCVVLTSLFFRPTWKAAFEPSHAGQMTGASGYGHREAA